MDVTSRADTQQALTQASSYSRDCVEGVTRLPKWAGIVDVALELEEKQRLEWADTYEGVVGFLENVAADLNMVEE